MTTETSSRQEPVAVVYMRVSTKRQMDTAADIDPEGNSIATQREACQRKAEQMGVRIIKEFVEPGTSAQTIEKRPVFREMIAYLVDNPGVDYVLIYMRSRAFRNFGDAVLTKRRLERMQIKLLSAKEDFGEGIMADAMEAVTDIINEVQVRMSGEDIRVKMRHKAQNGGTIGRARIGYRNIRVEHEGRMVNSIGLDEERAPLVRTAWELYATGNYTIDRLYHATADMGLTTRATRRSPAKPLAASQLHRMLSDPYYTGVVVYQGEIFPGRHPAIVDQELFDRVQEVLAARSANGQRDRVHFHYLKGLLFCDRCRKAGRTSRMIYTEVKGRSGTQYAYYMCRARQDRLCDLPHLPVQLVEDAVERYYGWIELGEPFTDEVIRLIRETTADEQRLVHELHARYRRQLKELDVREERLIDLAADGQLPKEKIRSRLHRIRVDRERAQAGLSETAEQLAVGAHRLETYLRLLSDPAHLYRISPDPQRRQLNDAFFERLYIDDQGVGHSWLTEVADELRGARAAYEETLVGAISDEERRRGGQRTESGPSDVLTGPANQSEAALLADHWVNGSSKASMVGLTVCWFRTSRRHVSRHPGLMSRVIPD